MNLIFYNLIGNALKFSKSGIAPKISISCRMLKCEEIQKNIHLKFNLKSHLSYAQIAIKDNGIGFEKQFAEQIFQIFERLNNQQQYSGTGIGLALCQKIAVHHQGGI
jgi:two-component system CheB/CheR fusion protein